MYRRNVKTSARRRLAAPLLALALALPAAPASAADAARVDELMDVLQLDEMTVQMQQMFDQVMEQAFIDSARENGLTPAQVEEMRPRIERIKATFRDVMSWAALAPEYRRIYIDVLSDEEVDAAIAYYRSPAGASMLAKMPELMQRGMEIGQRRAREAMPKAMAELKASFEPTAAN